MSPETTPGVDRLLSFEAAGKRFSVRRPSRADERRIYEVLVGKLMHVGSLAASLLDSFQGQSLLAEARFEVLMVPRTGPKGDSIDLGETGPENWFLVLRDEQKQFLGKSVFFDQVAVEEFKEAAAKLEEELKKKAPPTQP